MHRRRLVFLVAVLLAGLWLSAISTGPSSATATSAAPADAEQPSPPQPPRSPRAVTLEASATDAPAGRGVTLTARTNRSEDEASVITIRREAGHLGSGLEGTCRSRADCTVDVQADRPSASRFAAARYRCDPQGICVLEEDATESDKVRVTWR